VLVDFIIFGLEALEWANTPDVDFSSESGTSASGAIPLHGIAPASTLGPETQIG
jgi:hypothetical protein